MTLQAEYPGALWIPADPSNYYDVHRSLSSIDHIVIHITDGHADPRGTARMFATPKSKREPPRASSSHFIVGQDEGPTREPVVVQCVRLDAVALHAHSVNRSSVGIEHSARSPKEWSPTDPGLPVTDKMYLKSANLAAWLCGHLGLYPTRTVIQGHIEIDPHTSHEDCPNRIWDWLKYMKLVVGAYNDLKAGSLMC